MRRNAVDERSMGRTAPALRLMLEDGVCVREVAHSLTGWKGTWIEAQNLLANVDCKSVCPQLVLLISGGVLATPPAAALFAPLHAPIWFLRVAVGNGPCMLSATVMGTFVHCLPRWDLLRADLPIPLSLRSVPQTRLGPFAWLAAPMAVVAQVE